MSMKIAIAGGGICGLTLALAAKTAGITPVVIEQRPGVLFQTFGGGIGLWPPSQLVFQKLGILDKLEAASGKMPSAAYFNHKGQKLG
jgi:2-polyprenyl-6-methoxyphenol hydroxylase-like FAD-dependent oxidoreductase